MVVVVVVVVGGAAAVVIVVVVVVDSCSYQQCQDKPKKDPTCKKLEKAYQHLGLASELFWVLVQGFKISYHIREL